jgi:RiboL-PSP-HEPN
MSTVAPGALSQFKGSLTTAQALMSIEFRRYHDPPRTKEVGAVEGLRGGAAVLMVACFEEYLRQFAFQEFNKLAAPGVSVVFQKLPVEVQVHSVFTTLETAMQGQRWISSGTKHSRIPDIVIACQAILARRVNADVFSDTGGNPNAKNVREFFKRWGIGDVFTLSNARFVRAWGTPIPANLVMDKLDAIVQRRHGVAHTASALNISRADLKEAFRFLRVFSESVDMDARQHIRTLLRTAR